MRTDSAVGFVAGVAIGATLAWLTSAEATPQSVGPDVGAPARSRTSPGWIPPRHPAPETPAECPSFDDFCAFRMATSGCSPLPRPNDFAGTYDPASVEAWADQLTARCPTFRDEVLHVDCADVPCLLVVRSPTRRQEDVGGLTVSVSDAGSLRALTCGADGGPELTDEGESHHPDGPLVDFVAVWPESMYDLDVMRRLHHRKYRYTPERLERIIAEAE